MKIYLFAIGGSGSRVLRSLAMLLAAGVELPQGTELVPIILDPDQGAGNLTETVDLLKRYQSLRNQALSNDTKGHLTTFTSNIAPLDGQDFLIPLQGVANTTFKDYIGLNVAVDNQSPRSTSADLVKSLFSPDNLELDMQVGFKGNPNIGSVVLGQFVESKVFQDFLHDFAAIGGDKRIFIISSIFGGTGASGFPTLLKSLRQAQGTIGNAHIGALSLQPYFSIANDPNSAIDSRSFYAKTRAALSYYKENIIENNNINDFYFIGDKAPDMLDNHEGGQDQRNDAHFVELAGALSIIDFARKPQQEGASKAKMYEFGVQGEPQVINFKSLGESTERLLACPLTAFYLMHRYLEKYDLCTTPDAWLKDIQENLDIRFVDDLTDFLRKYFQWLEELGTATRSFAPIKLNQPESNLFDCVEGYPVTLGFMDKMRKQNFSLYTDSLNAKSKAEGSPRDSGELLNLLSNVSYDLCSDKINLPQ